MSFLVLASIFDNQNQVEEKFLVLASISDNQNQVEEKCDLILNHILFVHHKVF